jgi:hypothetical protein
MRLIVSSSEGPEKPFVFAHELVRQTLLADISAPCLQQLHTRVADAIERLEPGAVGERAGEIADHLLKAGSFADRRRLVRWLALAGKVALEAAAFEEERCSFQSVLWRQSAVDKGARADLLASFEPTEGRASFGFRKGITRGGRNIEKKRISAISTDLSETTRP